MKKLNRKTLQISAGFFAGMMATSSAHAGTNNWSTIAGTMTNSISELPGLLSGVSYMFGLLLGTLGVLKIKDHVENPGQTHLKDGAIRLAAGGALFALPMITEAMLNTIGDGDPVSQAGLRKVDMKAGLAD